MANKKPGISEIGAQVSADQRKRQRIAPVERKQFDIERDAPLHAAIARRDPEGTRRYLIQVATRLQDGEALPYAVRRWLAEALTAIANNPRSAAGVLGLAKHKRRPTTTQLRNMEIAERIRVLNGEGANIHEHSAVGADFAICTAAQEYGVSERVARKAWEQHGEEVKAFARCPERW
ncbi:MAG: hypothetical protein J0H15_06985 [Xanthomonadales bacterium]|nr:hypothetical protein [Xanthomonadales bacterium]